MGWWGSVCYCNIGKRRLSHRVVRILRVRFVEGHLWQNVGYHHLVIMTLMTPCCRYFVIKTIYIRRLYATYQGYYIYTQEQKTSSLCENIFHLIESYFHLIATFTTTGTITRTRALLRASHI